MPKYTVLNFLSLVKFSHTVFALPFAMVGFLLALESTHAHISWWLLLKVVLCMVFARNAAMAFNRYIDREIDKKNPRTFVREIPSGVITPGQAMFFIVANIVLFIATTYTINPICFYLSPVALCVVLGYSFTKRFTPLCHLVLGAGLALAPIGAYLAVTGHFNLVPLYYSFAVLCWVSGFDIIYALQDEDFDRENNLNSIPAMLGKKNALRVSELLHAGSAVFILLPSLYMTFTPWLWTGSAIFILLLISQHMIVKPHDLSRVNAAFFTTNGLASSVYFVFFLLDYLSR